MSQFPKGELCLANCNAINKLFYFWNLGKWLHVKGYKFRKFAYLEGMYFYDFV